MNQSIRPEARTNSRKRQTSQAVAAAVVVAGRHPVGKTAAAPIGVRQPRPKPRPRRPNREAATRLAVSSHRANRINGENNRLPIQRGTTPAGSGRTNLNREESGRRCRVSNVARCAMMPFLSDSNQTANRTPQPRRNQPDPATAGPANRHQRRMEQARRSAVVNAAPPPMGGPASLGAAPMTGDRTSAPAAKVRRAVDSG